MLLVHAARDLVGGELLLEWYCPVPGYSEKPLTAEIDEVARGSFKRKEPPEIRGLGYVVRSLEAALWTFDESVSFEEGCLLAMNLGDDADTTTAVYGQLAGAFYGEEEIPERCYRSWRIAVSSTTSPTSSLTPVPVQGSPKLVTSLS
jgi:ADP-ribosyl-[dinitrogen reductase] hydrolase